MSALAWLALALALSAGELLTGNLVMLLIGGAAAITALAVWLGLEAVTAQVLLFGGLTAGVVLVWYRRRPSPQDDTPATVNTGTHRWVGREIVLTEALTHGLGRTALDDTSWSVRGPDCAAGTRVRIQAIEGNTLVVTPLD